MGRLRASARLPAGNALPSLAAASCPLTHICARRGRGPGWDREPRPLRALCVPCPHDPRTPAKWASPRTEGARSGGGPRGRAQVKAGARPAGGRSGGRRGQAPLGAEGSGLHRVEANPGSGSLSCFAALPRPAPSPLRHRCGPARGGSSSHLTTRCPPVLGAGSECGVDEGQEEAMLGTASPHGCRPIA